MEIQISMTEESFSDWRMDPTTHPWFLSLFQRANVKLPDFIFNACVLDKGNEHLRGEGYPLRSLKGRTVSGCYAWLEEGEGEAPSRTMYVGRAVNLGNRIMSQWNANENFLTAWYEEIDEGTYFVPYIAIWITEQRESFCDELLYKLAPKYNNSFLAQIGEHLRNED